MEWLRRLEALMQPVAASMVPGLTGVSPYYANLAKIAKRPPRKSRAPVAPGAALAIPEKLSSMPKTMTLDAIGYTELPTTSQSSYPTGYGYGGYPTGYGYGGGYGYRRYGGGGEFKYNAPGGYPYPFQVGAGTQISLPQMRVGYQPVEQLPRWLQKLTTWVF